MTKIIKREARYMWLPAIMLLLVWISCAHLKKEMKSYETHTDSLRAEKLQAVSLQKKDGTANYKTSETQAQQAFASDNLVVKFNADTVIHTDPLQIWTDATGRLNINAGGRSVSSVYQKKSNASNNINSTKQAETHAASAIDSNVRAIDKSMEVKADKQVEDNKLERSTSFFAKAGIVAIVVLVLVVAFLAKKYWGKIKRWIEV